MYSKVLSNIEPFNEIYYRDCYYSALFPVLRYFGKSICPFLLNDIFLYQIDRNTKMLQLRGYSIKTETEILESLSIKCSMKMFTENLTENICSSICSNKPVIVLVDSFYESIRPDAYLKSHFPHFILIYGFDNLQKMFNIVEHRYRESFLFEHRIISYEDIINSYNGVVENLPYCACIPSYREYCLNTDKNSCGNASINNIYISVFINTMLDKIDEIYNGLEHLKFFKEFFSRHCFDEKWLKENADLLIDSFSKLINIKNAERYRISKVFGCHPEIITLIESITSDLNVARGIIGKFKFSFKYNPKSIYNTLSKLTAIYEKEIEYYNKLFAFLKSIYRNYTKE